MIEEHVHELPQHVVERLDELLAHGRVAGRRVEPPLGLGGGERDREAAARTGQGQRPGGIAAVLVDSERDRDVVWAHEQLDLLGQVPALAGEAERGQRPLPHDDGVDELDRHVPGVGAGRR